MFNDVRKQRHRQNWRRRNERAGRKVDAGADRTIIVAVVTGMLRRKRFRAVNLRAGSRDRRINPPDRVEVHMPEGKAQLQCQRSQRQPAANPAIITKPTHERLISVARPSFPDSRNCSGAEVESTRAKWRVVEKVTQSSPIGCLGRLNWRPDCGSGERAILSDQ